MPNSKVDIIIPVYNQPEITAGCLESIRKHSDLPHRVIIIDNASDQNARELLEREAASDKDITLMRNAENIGWVKAINQGIRSSKAPYVCIMNNDTIVRTDKWLSALVDVAEAAKETGLVNPRFEIKKKISRDAAFIEIDFCRGYCVLIKREVLEKIGGLDESYGLGYYDDDDLSVRAIRAGYRCVRANNVFVEHLGDATFSELFKDEHRRELHEKNKALFYSKWGKRMKLLFIITKRTDGSLLSETLFSMARDQHIVYLWRAKRAFNFRHINIRERRFPYFFSEPLFDMAVYLNNRKKPEKRYSMIFTDDEHLQKELSRIRPDVYLADIHNDQDKITELVRQAARK